MLLILLSLLYQIQVSSDNTFNSLIVDEVVYENVYENVNPLDNGEYYWRVRAYENELYSDWSDVWNFKIDTYIPPEPPRKPALKSPYDGAVIQDNLLQFSWNINEGFKYPPANGDTIFVEEGQSIQDAINISQPGDWIIVRDGVYRDSAKFNSVACIQWEWNPDTNWRILKSENLHGAEINGASMARTYGIYIHASSHWLIEGFEIDSCSWVGIYFEKKDTNMYIYRNKIHAICKDSITDGTFDYGRSGIGIDETDSAIVIDGNIIYDCGRLPYSAHEGAWSHNYKHDHGINCKGYDITIKNNIIYDNGAGWNLKIDGNDFADTGWSQIVVNNTFATIDWENPQRAGHIRFSKSSPCEYQGRPFIANNLFFDPPVSDSACRHAVDASAENYVSLIKNCLTNQDSIISYRMSWYIPNIEVVNCYVEYDPYMVNPNGFDFHLTDSSPCIDSGINEFAPLYDIEGIVRPQRNNFDIGAYEKE